MQLSKIELLSASLGILVLFVTGAGYLMVLNNEVNDLKSAQSKRNEEFKELKGKINTILNEKIESINKDREELTALKNLLEDKYKNKKDLFVSNKLDEAKSDLDNKKYKTSIGKLLEAIDNKPSADAYYLLAKAYKGDEQNLSALTSIDKAIKLDNKNYMYFYEKGNIFRDRRDHSSAIELYEKALTIKKDALNVINSMRYAYGELEDIENALKYANKYIELSDKAPMSYYYRGLAYKRAGDCDNAIRDFLKNIKLEEERGYDAYKAYSNKFIKQCKA